MPRLQAETLLAVRARIEAAARDLFIRQGFHGTTTRQIAEAAGMTAGALYAHYPSKEALFAAVAERYRTELADDPNNPVTRVLRTSRFPFDIPELALAVKKLIQTHRSYWLLWYVDVLEFEGRHFQTVLAPRAIVKLPELQARLAQLRADGTLRIEPELAFVMLYMHLFNYFLLENIFGGNEHYGVRESDAIDAIAEIFLRGMLVSPAAEQDQGGARRRKGDKS